MYRNVAPTSTRKKRNAHDNKKALIGGSILVALTGLLFIVVQDVEPTYTTVTKTITPTQPK